MLFFLECSSTIFGPLFGHWYLHSIFCENIIWCFEIITKLKFHWFGMKIHIHAPYAYKWGAISVKSPIAYYWLISRSTSWSFCRYHLLHGTHFSTCWQGSRSLWDRGDMLCPNPAGDGTPVFLYVPPNNPVRSTPLHVDHVISHHSWQLTGNC